MKASRRQCAASKHTPWMVAAVWLMATAAYAGGLSQGPTGAAAEGSNLQPAQPVLLHRQRYELQPGDVINVSFEMTPEFNQTLTVTPDGYVSLRGEGDISVTGMTVPELRHALVKAYTSILYDPVVDVNLKDFQKPFFTVGGQVAHPGKYDLREHITAAEALAMAGGVTNVSKSSQVLLFRPMPGGAMVEVRKLNMKRMLKKGNLREDVVLLPGDMLYVPKSGWAVVQRFLPSSEVGMYGPALP